MASIEAGKILSCHFLHPELTTSTNQTFIQPPAIFLHFLSFCLLLLNEGQPSIVPAQYSAWPMILMPHCVPDASTEVTEADDCSRAQWERVTEGSGERVRARSLSLRGGFAGEKTRPKEEVDRRKVTEI